MGWDPDSSEVLIILVGSLDKNETQYVWRSIFSFESFTLKSLPATIFTEKYPS